MVLVQDSSGWNINQQFQMQGCSQKFVGGVSADYCASAELKPRPLSFAKAAQHACCVRGHESTEAEKGNTLRFALRVLRFVFAFCALQDGRGGRGTIPRVCPFSGGQQG